MKKLVSILLVFSMLLLAGCGGESFNSYNDLFIRFNGVKSVDSSNKLFNGYSVKQEKVDSAIHLNYGGVKVVGNKWDEAYVLLQDDVSLYFLTLRKRTNDGFEETAKKLESEFGAGLSGKSESGNEYISYMANSVKLQRTETGYSIFYLHK